MYQKPTLQRFGALREMTQFGGNAGYDLLGLLITNDATSCDKLTPCVPAGRSS